MAICAYLCFVSSKVINAATATLISPVVLARNVASSLLTFRLKQRADMPLVQFSSRYVINTIKSVN